MFGQWMQASALRNCENPSPLISPLEFFTQKLTEAENASPIRHYIEYALITSVAVKQGK